MTWRDVVFQYDGTFEGFLCCVFESYVNKEFPIAFSGDEECWSLYDVRYVVTQREHASRVYHSILRRSKAAADVVRRGFLTCLPEKETRLYALIKNSMTRAVIFSATPPIRCIIPLPRRCVT